MIRTIATALCLFVAITSLTACRITEKERPRRTATWTQDSECPAGTAAVAVDQTTRSKYGRELVRIACENPTNPGIAIGSVGYYDKDTARLLKKETLGQDGQKTRVDLYEEADAYYGGVDEAGNCTFDPINRWTQWGAYKVYYHVPCQYRLPKG